MPRKKAALAISIGLFLAFVIFSYFVAKEKFTQFDFDTTVKIQNHVSHKFDLPFSILSLIGSTEISGLFWLGLVIFCISKKFYLAAVALFLWPFALVFEIFGKLFVYHPAPPHLLYRGVINLSLPSEYVPVDYSYPSGHVTRTAFLVVFLITWWNFRHSFKNVLIPQVLLIIFLVAMIIS